AHAALGRRRPVHRQPAAAPAWPGGAGGGRRRGVDRRKRCPRHPAFRPGQRRIEQRADRGMSGKAASGFDGKAFAAALSTAPGVYRMYAADDTLLYVGKARALRNRVGSYFNGSPKTRRIM